MAIAFSAVTPRHERRLRLTFTNTLASGAFGTPAPSFYTVTSQDDLGVSPTVSSALIVPNSPDTVELSLTEELVSGAFYTVAAIGVPATDLSVTPSGSELGCRYATAVKIDTRERSVIDRERLLYGSDLIWTGLDFQESPTGDLERVSGRPNVTKAIWRGVEANGLPWDDTWGGKAREFVDSPSSSGTTLRGAVVAHVLRDPRIAQARTELEIENATTYLHIIPTLRTGEEAEKVTLTVPNG